MILYHTITTYHLLCAIAHRIQFNSSKRCAVIISQWICEKFPQYIQLEAFFDVVIPYDAAIIVDKSRFYSAANDQKMESILRHYQITINDMEEIHVGGAHYAFGAYLTEHSIPYIYWEEAAGLLSRKEILRNNEQAQPEKQAYCDEKGLYDGSGINVIKRMCNMNAQIEGFHDDLAEDFDVSAELAKMPEEKRDEIIHFFTDAKALDAPEGSAIFLTQHFANLMLMSFEEQALMYQLYIDYFFDKETVIFKSHPDDLMYYSLLFPDCQVIRERFPSEFLPFMFTHKPRTIATVSSTGAFNLRRSFDSFFSMDFRFQEHFRDIHRYHAAVLLAKALGFDYAGTEMIGADRKLLENMFMKTAQRKIGIADKLYIVDDIDSEEDMTRENIISLAAGLSENSAMIFLNTKGDYCFHSFEQRGIWNNIIPMVISKQFTKGYADDADYADNADAADDAEFFSDTETEVIYFFSKDEELMKMAENFEFGRDLKYTGLKVSLDRLTPEQKQIKVLEGVLAATEERLLYYMNKEKTGQGSI